MSDWTPERVAEFRKLYAEGHSFGRIADMLGGVTRHACIGKAHRMKLPLRGYQRGAAVRHNKPKSIGGKIASMNRGKGKPFVFHQKAPAPLSPIRALVADGFPLPPPAETDVPRVSFNDLNEDGHRHCKWPCVKDVAGISQDAPVFCGSEPAFGSVYCKVHLQRSLNLSNPLRPISAPKQILQVA